MTKNIKASTIIVSACFIILLAIGTLFCQISFSMLLNGCLIRFARMGIFVLAMLPTIRHGMGPNFGLPVGILCGLLAEVIAVEYNFSGVSWLLASVVLAIVIATIIGYAYGKLMNAVKGSEMIVGVFTGWSAVILMGTVWASGLFKVTSMRLPSFGTRTTVQLDQINATMILDKFLAFKIGPYLTVPTGALLVFFLLCFLLYMFFRSKHGKVVSASGADPIFVRAVDNSRIIASILSTVLGALGIIVYGQSFGYAQLYDAPMMMALPAAAAILVGGATAQRANVLHVVLGAFIFNSLLATSMPVFDSLLVGESAVLSNVVLQMLQCGIILYALVEFCKKKA
jgi:simple sugar transport system permease protein